ncbi:MAG: hypothetical protein HS104_06765 [Polyangiaceae bacterium]|nr:hypothetical protein [Polyangiaceae bacterium]MCL4753166.1 hypothetical protein [Myxococcales bacterium]
MTHRLSPISTYTGRWAALLLGATLVAFGCSKEATPSAEQPKPPSQGTPTEVTPAAVGAGDKAGAEPAVAKPEGAEEGEGAAVDLAAAKGSYSEETFKLEMKGGGDYKAGQQGSVEIVLEAKAPFHANDKYPYKFKTAETAGVTYPSAIVKKDQAKIENMKVTMPVAFTAEKGKKQIKGVFHFSVCTDDKCLIEKRALAVDVDVK